MSTNKTSNNKCWRVENKESSFTAGGNLDWYSHYGKQYTGSSKKLRIVLPYDPATLLLSIYLKRLENIYSQRYIYPYVHCSIIHLGQDMERTKVSFNRGLDKEDVVHMYNEILLSHKKR